MCEIREIKNTEEKLYSKMNQHENSDGKSFCIERKKIIVLMLLNGE